MQVDVLQDGEKISIQVERVGDQFVVRIGEHHHHVHVVRWKNGRRRFCRCGRA